MNATATIRIELDHPKMQSHIDPLPETDAIESIDYALGSTSPYFRQVNQCVIFEQSIDWMNQLFQTRNRLSRARAQSAIDHATQYKRERFTSKYWDAIRWDRDPCYLDQYEAQKKSELAVALAPYLNADDSNTIEMIETLLRLSELEHDWNGTGGEQLNFEDAVRSASLVSAVQQSISESPFMYPSPEGGVVVELSNTRVKIVVLIEHTLGILSSLNEVPKAFDISAPAAWNEFIDEITHALSNESIGQS